MDFIFNYNLPTLIQTVGLVGLFFIIFAESGLLIGFFLPGDSLLFTAGILASQGYLNIWILMAVTFAGAVLGDSVGYTFGRKVGPKIFTRENSLIFHRENLAKAKRFYEQYGPVTIVLARFMPFIRTFAPILAGVGEMHYPTFLLYNVAGGIIWAIGIPVLGFLLGNAIPDVDRYLLPLVAGIILVTSIPPIFHFIRNKERRMQAKDFIFSIFRKK